MAKTIKFNLICDGNPVRTIEDLQNNFSIEDVLDYYNNGLLDRWLTVRGYSEEQKKVSEITSKDSLNIIRKLIDIFNVTIDIDKVDESIYMMEYLNEREKAYKEYEMQGNKVQTIINDYKDGYEDLIRGIMEHPEDLALIKANIRELADNYKWILDLDHRRLFRNLFDKKQYLAIMCLLMNKDTRKYYLLSDNETDDADNKDMAIVDKKAMYRRLTDLIGSDEFYNSLGENLKGYSGETENYWEDLETNDKQYMIVDMGEGDNVRSLGKKGEELSAKDIKNKFVILDGIDYRSNNANHRILYMEV